MELENQQSGNEPGGQKHSVRAVSLPSERTLKIVVSVMGILLIAGMVVVFSTILLRSLAGGQKLTVSPMTSVLPTPTGGTEKSQQEDHATGNLEIGLPAPQPAHDNMVDDFIAKSDKKKKKISEFVNNMVHHIPEDAHFQSPETVNARGKLPFYVTHVKLPVDASLSRVDLGGDMLALEFQLSGGTYILLYDAKKGHLIGKFVLSHE
ncbi:MAG: hypothetical protein PSN37_03675 [Alphaproteobacteria bacterium]|nr:hypothetical protein [Alphaproteobacteria bacterium]